MDLKHAQLLAMAALAAGPNVVVIDETTPYPTTLNRVPATPTGRRIARRAVSADKDRAEAAAAKRARRQARNLRNAKGATQ